MPNVYAVVMAGGRGERFWPLSTDERPKPFLPLLGTTTLLQDTVERLRPLIPLERILVSFGAAHRNLAREQLPQLPHENYIVEPLGRDTSACLGFSALHLERKDPDAIMLAVPADHFITDDAAFRRTLQKGIDNLAGATAVVFGISPARPETGYGYIQAEKPAVGSDAWPVIRFIEKPDAASAARFVESGGYFWNSGMFLWSNRTLLELLQKHMPATYRALDALRPLLGRSDANPELLRIFSGLQRISIDFGVLEKTSRLRLVPAEFGWDDIGNWASLERALAADAHGNVARGRHAAVHSNGCILYSDAGTIAAFGVSELVIVQAHGRVLVCPKRLAADLKRLVTAVGPE